MFWGLQRVCLLDVILGSVSANTGEKLIIKDHGGVVMQEGGGRGALESKSSAVCKKVKIMASLVAFVWNVPKPSGVSGQEAAAKLRMRMSRGDHGSYTGLDFWLIGNLFVVSFSITLSSGLHKTIYHIESLFFAFSNMLSNVSQLLFPDGKQNCSSSDFL